MDFVISQAPGLEGEPTVPGDKAISHRALIVGAVTERPLYLTNLSTASDVRSTLQALGAIQGHPRSLVQRESWARESYISQNLVRTLERGGSWTIDCGNSGSTMRMLMGLLAAFPGVEAILIGDASLSRRPMDRIAAPLRSMGARIALQTGGVPPVALHGERLKGIDYAMPVASAQLKTAMLLAGLRAEAQTTLSEPAQSRDHTERLLAFLGLETRVGPKRYRVQETNLLGDKEINVPGDFSSASFLLTAAALMPGGDLTVRNTGLNPTRIGFLDVLRAYGARVTISDATEVSGEPRGTIRVRADASEAFEVPVDLIPGVIDELPLVAVLAATATGTTEVRGAEELRVKETDRIAAIVAGLRAMGADIRALPDGFVVEGPCRLGGARVDSEGDHRIAMALAVAGLVAEGETTIAGWECVDISFPGFAEVLRSVTGSVGP